MAEGGTFHTKFDVCSGGIIYLHMGEGDHNVFENFFQSMGTARLSHDSVREETPSQELSQDDVIKEYKKVIEEISELVMEPDCQLKIAITILDHHVMVNDDESCNDALKTFQDIIKTQPRCDDIIQLANDYATKKKYFRAFLTLRAATEWFGKNGKIEMKSMILTPLEVILGMAKCVAGVITDKSLKVKTCRQIISLIHKAIDNIKQIEEANEKEKIECEGLGLLLVAEIHFNLEECQEAYEVSCRGIDVMQRFQENESGYAVCALLKDMKSVAAIQMRRENAEDLMNEAKSALQRAEKLNENVKNKHISKLDEMLKELKIDKQAV